MGLQGERCGNVNFVCTDKNEAQIVSNQLKIAATSIWLTPPLYGAHIVNTILSDENLTKMWH